MCCSISSSVILEAALWEVVRFTGALYIKVAVQCLDTELQGTTGSKTLPQPFCISTVTGTKGLLAAEPWSLEERQAGP